VESIQQPAMILPARITQRRNGLDLHAQLTASAS
jgi:hypothetical protein